MFLNGLCYDGVLGSSHNVGVTWTYTPSVIRCVIGIPDHVEFKDRSYYDRVLRAR